MSKQGCKLKRIKIENKLTNPTNVKVVKKLMYCVANRISILVLALSREHRAENGRIIIRCTHTGKK